jgi:hypothetical protein
MHRRAQTVPLSELRQFPQFRRNSGTGIDLRTASMRNSGTGIDLFGIDSF